MKHAQAAEADAVHAARFRGSGSATLMLGNAGAELGSWAAAPANKLEVHNPQRHIRYTMAVRRTPSPYTQLRRKLMLDASGKYLVGQEISPRRKRAHIACAIIWLSNTKSSEQARSGN